MIEKVTIIIQNGLTSENYIETDYKTNKCIVNNKEYKIDEEFKNKLLRIVYTWKDEVINNNIIDDIEYTLYIKDNITTNKIHGKGTLPSNYNELLELINTLHE